MRVKSIQKKQLKEFFVNLKKTSKVWSKTIPQNTMN